MINRVYDYITMDLTNREVIPKIECTQGVSMRGVKIKTGLILTNETVNAYMLKPDKTEVYNSATIDSDSIIIVDFSYQMVAAAGIGKLQVEIISEGGENLKTFVIDVEIEESVISNSAVPSSSEYGALETLVSEAQTAIAGAEAATTLAETAATAASAAAELAAEGEILAREAATSANSAASAASTAATSANSAASAASTAAAEADTAATNATQAAELAREAVAAIGDVATANVTLSQYTVGGSITLYRWGRIVIMNMDTTGANGLLQNTTYSIGTIPQGFRPVVQVRPISSGGYLSDWAVQYDIYPDGRFTMYPFKAGKDGGRPIRGAICWITNEV